MISRSSNSHRLGTCSPAPTLCCLDKHKETFIIIVIESVVLDFFGFKIIYLTMFKSQWRHCIAMLWRWPFVRILCIGGGAGADRCSCLFCNSQPRFESRQSRPIVSSSECVTLGPAWARCWPTRKLESSSNYPGLITDIRTRHFVYHSPFTLFTRSIRWK